MGNAPPLTVMDLFGKRGPFAGDILDRAALARRFHAFPPQYRLDVEALAARRDPWQLLVERRLSAVMQCSEDVATRATLTRRHGACALGPMRRGHQQSRSPSRRALLLSAI
jgi:hypothetical protein